MAGYSCYPGQVHPCPTFLHNIRPFLNIVNEMPNNIKMNPGKHAKRRHSTNLDHTKASITSRLLTITPATYLASLWWKHYACNCTYHALGCVATPKVEHYKDGLMIRH
ncbi:hypothetical protein BC938DRAFT_477170 [Jimgerdemannia flammicorona]|uniref:Uncharacterized protein n=1 Tax=Jimgerdemannia flammicorona TaxID=994334 RepID=A0A433PBG4_9FUNG|nr:hypothetical protein BC938DRAFT_477170 [Jimgerdemannia flammicorona]